MKKHEQLEKDCCIAKNIKTNKTLKKQQNKKNNQIPAAGGVEPKSARVRPGTPRIQISIFMTKTGFFAWSKSGARNWPGIGVGPKVPERRNLSFFEFSIFSGQKF